jgi:hypothetical protein
MGREFNRCTTIMLQMNLKKSLGTLHPWLVACVPFLLSLMMHTVGPYAAV